MIAKTAAQASPNLRGALSGEIEQRIEILSKNALHMLVTGAVDLEKAFGPLVFRYTDASFSTFNSSRMYRLCISISFQCAEKILKFELADLPLNIIADSRDPENTVPNIAIQVPEEDPPSAYTSDSISSPHTSGTPKYKSRDEKLR